MIRLPDPIHPRALTDWVEANLLFAPTGPEGNYSFAEMQSIFEQAEMPHVEDHVTNINLTIQTREVASGPAYPVATYGLGFRRRGDWQAFAPYCFLLLLSLRHYYRKMRMNKKETQRDKKETLRGAELFEFLSLFSLQRYLKGQGIRIGFPRRRPIPSNFSRSVEYVCEECKELFGGGVLTAGDEQDDKLDLVGWLPFPDRRPGQIVILAQCGIGADWDTKLTQLDINIWNRHVRWHVFPPARAFFVPFHHENGIAWGRSSAAGGIIFDRLRVAWLSGQGELPQEFVDSVREWCGTQIQRLHQLGA